MSQNFLYRILDLEDFFQVQNFLKFFNIILVFQLVQKNVLIWKKLWFLIYHTFSIRFVILFILIKKIFFLIFFLSNSLYDFLKFRIFLKIKYFSSKFFVQFFRLIKFWRIEKYFLSNLLYNFFRLTYSSTHLCAKFFRQFLYFQNFL